MASSIPNEPLIPEDDSLAFSQKDKGSRILYQPVAQLDGTAGSCDYFHLTLSKYFWTLDCAI